ncbi:hypothetical protein [Nocardia huaxiensis]|uniref:Uncharacterized protein n=1 Tax=Nocardia huaxiensis TaxID=2755382 RepID=A0A7D6V8C0_9NOCA|nr:hypothetical protein [Nocardia huaxiensis]QLY30041.1 hypothetical protein H0264_33440 [Nocardia huaxiensis]UFS96361.1 hypothetical protein LPY97_38010 [Nocardia huaxiensis]
MNTSPVSTGDSPNDIHQVVALADGSLAWKPADPISQWTFGTDPRPDPTYRDQSYCTSGSL